MWAEAHTTHCLSVCLSTGCEELLKDVLSVESAGTLPCSPEIPDCVEQVRAVAQCLLPLTVLLAIGTWAWLCRL